MELKLTTSADVDNPVEGDLHLENGQLVFFDGLEAIAQAVRSNLRFFKGEWFLNRLEGFPYFEEVFVKGPDLNVLRALFKKAIRNTNGIVAVNTLNIAFNRATRTATINFDAVTVTGAILKSADFAPFIVELS